MRLSACGPKDGSTIIGLRCALAFRGEVESAHRPPRLTARIAEIQAMINPAADDRAVGKFRPISRPNDARIARSYVKQAIGIAAKRVIPCVRVHEVADAPPALKGLENAGFLDLALYTVPRMGRDFNVSRLSDEFGQYLFAALQATDESHPVSSTDNLLGRLLSGRHSGGRVVRTDAKDSVANANVYCFAGRIRNFSPVAFRWYARITSGSSASASEISRV